MPTVMTHALLPLAAGMALGQGRIPRGVMMCGIALAMLPDADVVGFRLGIDYADSWGHRGASHSLIIAAVVAVGMTAILRAERWRLACVFLFLSMASHGLLDALTNGGLGPALFWPMDETRHFASWRPIRVSPIGAGFFSWRGVETLISEAIWVWLPVLSLAIMGRAIVKQRSSV